MGFLDKIKDVAGKNPDKVDKVTEKAGDMFDDKTGGKFSEHTDTAQEKVGEYLTGEQSGGEPGQPGGEGAPGGEPGQPGGEPGEPGQQPPA